MESMTRTSMGSLAGTSLRPRFCSRAMVSEGASVERGGAGVAQGRPGEFLDVEVAGEAGVVDDGTGFNFGGAGEADGAGE